MKMAKQMEKLVSGIRCVSQRYEYGMLQPHASSPALAIITEAELARVIGDVISVTVSVSIVLFNGIVGSFAARKLPWTQMVKLSRKAKRVIKEQEGIEELQQQDGVESLGNLKEKGDEEVRSVLKRMRDFEGCISVIESVSEKVFGALINSRVALLNTLTQ